MQFNTDKMIEEQNNINERIFKEKPINETVEETVAYYDKQMPTKTNMIIQDDRLLLTRYLFNEIVKVEFSVDVKAVVLIPYIELGDGDFIKCKVRS